MTLPSRQHYIFAVKTFGAALLALYLAFSFDLPRPSWSMLTVFIVSQPFAGMVASKAVYRVAGTIVGAVISSFILIGFADAPELQALALAVWVGLCIYVACLERSPRAYAFLLSGYTAVFIGFPTVSAPAGIFDAAIARSEEIILAILCATLVHTIVLPQRAGPVLSHMIDRWFADAARWVEYVVGRPDNDARGAFDHRRLVAESGDIERLRVHALYDTPELRRSAAAIGRLQTHMQSILSLLLAVEDRLTILRRERPDLVERLRGIHGDFISWLRATAMGPACPAESAALLASIDATRPSGLSLRADPQLRLFAALVERLRDLVLVWNESLTSRSGVKSGRPLREAVQQRTFHADYLMAAFSGLAAVIVICICCAFWIGAAWPDGYTAAMMAAVGCSLGATFDDPAGFLLKFLQGTVIGTVIAAFYIFGVFPVLSGFDMLALALAPAFLLLCTMMAMPAYTPLALPMLLTMTAMMNIENRMTYDFAIFMNFGVAQVFGIALAAAVLAVARASGAELMIRRITGAIHLDLGRLARGDRKLTRESFESVMLDRVEGLMQRRGSGSGDIDALIDGALASVRVGLNIAALRRHVHGLPRNKTRVLARVFAIIATHFSPSNREHETSYAAMGAALDEAIAEVAHDEGEQATPVLIGLSGLRQIMLGHPDFFRAPPASGVTLAKSWVGSRIYRVAGRRAA
ncbi:hypothetical protein F2P47_16030 [Parvibaculum sedimenti]|uniref:FUSC family protein n=1 Tax=Parvibaculum sedimenti TaxID=2608632 RepID=A0A6N6VDJ8_9HYPH|nr:FUSC family protein [Parvibaculum sedimenti]KAB7738630.1 hypothetical protein F2P47_16030 [Parvibaculum sedimenti]